MSNYFCSPLFIPHNGFFFVMIYDIQKEIWIFPILRDYFLVCINKVLNKSISLIFIGCKLILKLHGTLFITYYCFQTAIMVHLLNTKNSGPNPNFQCLLMGFNSHNLFQLMQCRVKTPNANPQPKADLLEVTLHFVTTSKTL